MWLSSYFLVLAGLFLSSSARMDEECELLVAALPQLESSLLMGRTNFLAGYTDHKVFTEIIKLTNSCWMNLTATSEPHVVQMAEENRINGTCVSTTANVHINGNAATTTFENFTSEFHLLPACDGCMVFSINTTARNTQALLAKMNLHFDDLEDEFHVHSLYLMSSNEVLSETDYDNFKKQAACFGFSGEPQFLYDSSNKFCAEGEGIRLN